MMMKKCKSCQSEIDTKANKCPKCQADQRNWFRKHPILTGVLILFIIGMFGSAGSSKNTSSNNTSSKQVTTTKEVPYTIGEVINTNKFEITVTSIEERSVVGSEYFKKSPSQGGTFVAIQYQYKNKTDKPIGSFSTPTIKLVDANGTQYSSDTGASSNFATELKLDRKILSDLNPGITVNDAAIFEVSKEQYAKQGWKLLIKADKDNNVTIK